MAIEKMTAAMSSDISLFSVKIPVRTSTEAMTAHTLATSIVSSMSGPISTSCQPTLSLSSIYPPPPPMPPPPPPPTIAPPPRGPLSAPILPPPISLPPSMFSSSSFSSSSTPSSSSTSSSSSSSDLGSIFFNPSCGAMPRSTISVDASLIGSTNSEVNILKNLLQSIGKQVKESQIKAENAENENNILKAELHKKQLDHEKTLALLKARINTLITQKISILKELETTRNDNDRLVKEKRALLARHREQSVLLHNQYNSEKEKLTKQIAALNSRIDILTVMGSSNQRDHDAQMEELNKKLEAAGVLEANLREEMEEAQKREAALNSEMEELTRRIDELNTIISSLKTKESFRMSREHSLHAEITHIRSEIARLKQENADLEFRITTQQTQIKELESTELSTRKELGASFIRHSEEQDKLNAKLKKFESENKLIGKLARKLDSISGGGSPSITAMTELVQTSMALYISLKNRPPCPCSLKQPPISVSLFA